MTIHQPTDADTAMTTDPALPFAPHAALARALLPHALGTPGGTSDGAHDIAHLLRVWRNVQRIASAEGGDLELLLAATLLHDCVNVEKDSPLRAQASRLSAEKARGLLAHVGWASGRVEAAAHAIEAHSYSAAIVPRSLEARILQDADRLDAIGLVGAARCFYVGGRMGRALYDPADARAAQRPLDDGRFTLDHFQRKLFHLASGFQTSEGARLAAVRQQRLRDFYEGFLEEIEQG